jgi:UDP-N-acetyl-2-amino-2-deoxyglucuronate dehydrogenase
VDHWGISHELLIQDFYARLANEEPFWIDPAEAQKTLEIVQEVYDQSYPERAGHSTATTERNAVS